MLSIIVIAKNEASNIRCCLESIQWADEIIVLDSGSTDNTVSIAKEYTPHVFETDWCGYGVQKQRALERATGDWVLNLDADESVSTELQHKIKAVMAEKEVDACRIPIQMVFYGKKLRYSSSPSRHIRLFKREGARYSDDIVHEKILLPSSSVVKQLNLSISHHSFQDLSHALYKLNRYSSYTSKSRIKNGKRAGFYRSIFGSVWMFFRCYVLQRGILDGQVGFLLAMYHAQGTFYRGMKQVYQDKDIEEILAESTYRERKCE